jgi:capsular polysaccharide biosynthesis protein
MAQARAVRAAPRRPRDIAETAPAHDPIGPHPLLRIVLGVLLGAAGGTVIIAVTRREGAP